jgi:pimeloyl-ACP methyl ester carboxylesterase
MKHQIDALRFRLKKMPQQRWSHPDMQTVDLSIGGIRLLDTREGKQAVMIIPDGPNLIEHYFPMLAALRKQFRVIIFDFPGFGFSYHNGRFNYSFAHTNQLLLELLDLLGIERINLALPCANGFYGLAFAHAHPEKVNQLILSQTPALSEMKDWTRRVVPGFLKVPYLGQLAMPFVEEKFANQWYNYALPKHKDREPYRSVAVEGVKKGACFCLCSLTQGLIREEKANLGIDPSIPLTLLYGDSDFTHRPTDLWPLPRPGGKPTVSAGPGGKVGVNRSPSVIPAREYS